MIEIQWLGHACFRIKSREGIVVTDPYGPETSYDLGRPTAHLVTVSHDEPDHNNVAGVKGHRGPFVVLKGPGEYEVGGIFIMGIRTYRDMRKGKSRGKNTVYLMEFSEMNICHLGDLGHPLSDEELSDISKADVLLIPVGGKHSLVASRAAEVVAQIEPRIVIPMHYSHRACRIRLDSVNGFFREMGIKPVAPLDSLKIGSGDLPDEDIETQVVLLKVFE
jgi:L-ascorbate metabolism protein UlaG (beta-lactamase superfamily)